MPKGSPGRKKSDSSANEYIICVNDRELSKNKKHANLPSGEMVKEMPQKGDESNWFGWDHTKKYIPIMIKDKKTKKMVSLTQKVVFNLKYESATGVNLVYSTATSCIRGTYWFRTFKCYSFGKYTLSFSLETDPGDATITDITRKIFVKVDAEGNGPSSSQEAFEEVKKKRGRKHGDSSLKTKKEALETDEGGFDLTERASKKQKKDGRVGKRGRPPGSVSTKKQKEKETFRGDVVQPIPPQWQLQTKNRLLYLPESDSRIDDSDENGGKYVFEGKELKLTLSKALLQAHLEDQVRVTDLHRRFEQGYDTNTIENTEQYRQYPTVNEFFAKLLHKTNHMPEAEHVIQQFRLLFEFCFEKNILYEEEQTCFHSKIKKIKQEQLKFGDHFGATYYLRFLLFVVTGADLVTADTPKKEAAGNSSQRRNAVSDRHHKAIFSTAQLLLDKAVSELDDSSGILFS